jgi:hypothetical protein
VAKIDSLRKEREPDCDCARFGRCGDRPVRKLGHYPSHSVAGCNQRVSEVPPYAATARPLETRSGLACLLPSSAPRGDSTTDLQIRSRTQENRIYRVAPIAVCSSPRGRLWEGLGRLRTVDTHAKMTSRARAQRR